MRGICRGTRRRTAPLAMAALALAVAAPAAHAGLLGNLVTQTQSSVIGQTRGTDQLANPDYLARALPDAVAYLAGTDTKSVLVDPFRKSWAPGRGASLAISYVNRYGATIRGHLWAPPPPYDGPLPAVIMLNGLGGSEQGYWGLDQSLAESGYVVMSFDPQGMGASDVDPSPKAVFCDPAGAWREPQEMGLREQGPCAGVLPPPDASPGVLGPLADAVAPVPVLNALVAGAAFLEALRLERPAFDALVQRTYDETVPNFALGALDAVAWLRSAANPWRALVDTGHIGLMGHSLGAYGALLAANGDPLHRFSAVVTYDGHGTPPAGFAPSVPTMVQLAENADTDYPALTPVGPDDHPSAQIGIRLRAAHDPMMQVALRGSTHQEWSYVPVQGANPVAGPFTNASSKGERVGLYYALAWFDRWLKGQQADADRRLLARTFDASVDRSSIGQGRFELLTLRNRPYTIAGEPVAARLSALLRSAYDFDGLTCLDAARGC